MYPSHLKEGTAHNNSSINGSITKIWDPFGNSQDYQSHALLRKIETLYIVQTILYIIKIYVTLQSTHIFYISYTYIHITSNRMEGRGAKEKRQGE